MEIGFIYTESMTNPGRAADVFAEIRGMGGTAVGFHMYEQDLRRWPKDVPRIHDVAARAGLRRYVSFAHLGGMMAGLHSIPDEYTHIHPESRVTPPVKRSRHDTSPMASLIACVNDPGFRQYARDHVAKVMRELRPDGLSFDEPAGLIHDFTCSCEHCVAGQRPGESALEAQRRYQTDFFSELAAIGREANPELRTMAVVAIGTEQPERFELSARVRGLDAIAIEPFWAFVEKDLAWLDETCRSAATKIRGVGKQLDVWAMNFNVTRERQAELPEGYEIIARSRPDAIWQFWYWRANDDPDEVMRLTREGLARILPGSADQ